MLVNLRLMLNQKWTRWRWIEYRHVIDVLEVDQYRPMLVLVLIPRYHYHYYYLMIGNERVGTTMSLIDLVGIAA